MMKVVMITGAGSGIGKAVALKLAADKDVYVIAISKNASKLEALHEECDKRYGFDNVMTVPFDLASKNYDKIARVTHQMREVNVLINNAAILVNKQFLDLSDEDWQEMFEVNVFGVARMIKTVAPLMGHSEKGHIVNIGSLSGFQSALKFKGLTAYSASKAALSNMTECLAEEFYDLNISVNCLALGGVKTEMLKQSNPAAHEHAIDTEHAADYISQFALTNHHFMSGKIIPVSLTSK